MRFGCRIIVEEVFAASADSYLLLRISVTDVTSGLDARGATANNQYFLSALDLVGSFRVLKTTLTPCGESLRVFSQKVRSRFRRVNIDGAITSPGGNDQRVIVEGLRVALGCGNFNLIRGCVDILEHCMLVGDVAIFAKLFATEASMDSFKSTEALRKLVRSTIKVIRLDNGAECFGDVLEMLRLVDDGNAVLRGSWVTSNEAAGHELAAI